MSETKPLSRASERMTRAMAPLISPASRPYVLYAVSKIGPGLIMFAAVPIWTRAFGAEQYGLYSVCWVATLLSSAFFTGWLRQAVLRHAGDPNFDLNVLPLWVMPTCALIGVLPVIVIVWIESAAHTSADVVGLVLTSALFACLNSYYTVAQTRSQRHDHVGRFASAELVRIGAALGLSLTGTFLFGQQGSVSIVGAYCVGTAIGLAILVRGFPKKKLVVVRTPHVLGTFWSYGWPMTLWLAVSSMLLYSDRLIIGILLDAKAVGTYGSISDLVVRGIGMLTFPLTMKAHPALMRMWNSGDRSRALLLSKRYMKYTVVLCGVCVALGAMTGSRILEQLLGVDIESPLIVPALLAGAALSQVGLMSHKPLEMADRTRTMLVTLLSITALSVTANVVLIPHLGLVAPALVFFTGSACYVIATLYLSTRVQALTSPQKGEQS